MWENMWGCVVASGGGWCWGCAQGRGNQGVGGWVVIARENRVLYCGLCGGIWAGIPQKMERQGRRGGRGRGLVRVTGVVGGKGEGGD